MSYDPDPKRRKGRKGRVPPQLRAWVYGRRKLDPKRRSMAYGYGKIGGKPYRKGGRGGVYWSGGRKPRYDPARPKGYYRAKVKGFGAKIAYYADKYLPIGSGIMGFLIPKAVAIQKYVQEVEGRTITIFDAITKEWIGKGHIQNDFLAPKFDRVVDKLTNPSSHYGAFFGTFWSGVALSISMAFPLPFVPPKVRSILKKFGAGLATGSFLSALFSSWQSPPVTPEQASSGNTNKPQTSFYG